MPQVSATEASKRFADLLDAVEHRGETYTIMRRGHPVATITPARRTTFGGLREFVRTNPPDPDWEADVSDVKRLVGPAPAIDPWRD